MPFTYDFPRPAVTVDVALFAMRARDLAVLLVQRGRAPAKGQWALPGGYVERDEPLVHAAQRELAEETGVTGVALDQVGAFGDPGRDPRGHTITVAFTSFVLSAPSARAGDDARDVAWVPLSDLALPSLLASPGRRRRPRAPVAFDHGLILEAARQSLRERLVHPTRPSAFELLPARFTLTELQRVHEAVLGRALAPRSFRAKVVERGVVEPASRPRAGGTRGKERLYRFRPAGF